MANELEHVRGDSRAVPFIMERPTAPGAATWAAVNLTGAQIRFTVKRRLTDPPGAALIAKTSMAAQIVIRDQAIPANAGLFDVLLIPADTENILVAGGTSQLILWYDVEVTELNGTKTTIVRAPFILQLDVTSAV